MDINQTYGASQVLVGWLAMLLLITIGFFIGYYYAKKKCPGCKKEKNKLKENFKDKNK